MTIEQKQQIEIQQLRQLVLRLFEALIKSNSAWSQLILSKKDISTTDELIKIMERDHRAKIKQLRTQYEKAKK